MRWVYACALFLACLAALIAGWVVGERVDLNNPSEGVISSLTVGSNAATSSDITDYLTVQEYGAEAQGTYISYNDYEAHVAEIVNDRGAK